MEMEMAECDEVQKLQHFEEIVQHFEEIVHLSTYSLRFAQLA